MKVTILPANRMCTKQEWGLSIQVAIIYISSGTKVLLRQGPSPYSSSRQMLGGELTLQTRETATSDNGLI
jgi:hypothetical protein